MIKFVVYHPHLAFLVDEDGSWDERRDHAKAHGTYENAMATIDAAVGNGLDPIVAAECRILIWI